ncbi:hypothetical protein ACJZ2D_001437 [Fusarium nematophilum]
MGTTSATIADIVAIMRQQTSSESESDEREMKRSESCTSFTSMSIDGSCSGEMMDGVVVSNRPEEDLNTQIDNLSKRFLNFGINSEPGMTITACPQETGTDESRQKRTRERSRRRGRVTEYPLFLSENHPPRVVKKRARRGPKKRSYPSNSSRQT